jgi:hypothetical protein
MAIEKTVTTQHGIEVKNAYHRVEGLSVVRKDKIHFHVRSSVDGVLPHFLDTDYQCAYTLDGENPIKQAYEHLKTLPEFSGATDC